MTTTQIDKEFDNIAAIRSKMIDPVKLQLHSGIEGFDSPESFGIYRKTGGKPLGTVGRVYEPPNLNLFLDSIVKSICDCCASDYDLSQLSYKEYKEGQKISFDLPSKPFEVKSKIVGDVFQTNLNFITGFDGLTKTSLSFSVLRLICSNGAKRWGKDIELSFKNTSGNVGKLEYFGTQIIELGSDITRYKETLDKLAKKEVTQSQIDSFMKKVFGFNQAEYKELSTRKRNILDRINQSVAIEQNSLGTNAYSLLQGITRYTTHEISNSPDDLFFGGAATINAKAHVESIALLN